MAKVLIKKWGAHINALRAKGLPIELIEILEGLEEQDRLVNEVVKLVSSLTVYETGVKVGIADILDLIEDGNITLTPVYHAATKKVDIKVRAVAGGSIPPFTTLFLWNETDYSQFDQLHKVKTAGLGVTFTFVTNTVATGKSNNPYLAVTGVNGGPDDRAGFFTKIAYAPDADHFLVIEFEGWPTDPGAHTMPGLMFSTSGSEWTDNYWIAVNTGHSWSFGKTVAGVTYACVNTRPGPSGGSITLGDSGKKCRWVIYANGDIRLYVGGCCVFHHDAIDVAGAETTKLTSGKIGVVCDSATNIWMSALRIYLGPLGAETLL